MPGITTRRPRRGLPERYRAPSQRGTHSAGFTFVDANVVSAVPTVAVMLITFDQPVTLTGVPGILTDLAPTPLSATQPAPNQVAITFSATVALAAELVIPQNDPAIRTASGGWAASNTFPV